MLGLNGWASVDSYLIAFFLFRLLLLLLASCLLSHLFV